MTNLRRIGQNTGGIRTLDDVRARCTIGDESGCWMWLGAMTCSNKPFDLPVAWYPKEKRIVTVARIVADLTGLFDGGGRMRAWRTCREARCCNPAHIAAGTAAEWGAWITEAGYRVGNASVKAANTRNSRSRSSLSESAAHEIRTSSATGRSLSARFGVSETTISRIRTRRTWRAPSVIDSSECRPWAAAVAR